MRKEVKQEGRKGRKNKTRKERRRGRKEGNKQGTERWKGKRERKTGSRKWVKENGMNRLRNKIKMK